MFASPGRTSPVTNHTHGEVLVDDKILVEPVESTGGTVVPVGPLTIDTENAAERVSTIIEVTPSPSAVTLPNGLLDEVHGQIMDGDETLDLGTAVPQPLTAPANADIVEDVHEGLAEAHSDTEDDDKSSVPERMQPPLDLLDAENSDPDNQTHDDVLQEPGAGSIPVTEIVESVLEEPSHIASASAPLADTVSDPSVTAIPTPTTVFPAPRDHQAPSVDKTAESDDEDSALNGKVEDDTQHGLGTGSITGIDSDIPPPVAIVLPRILVHPATPANTPVPGAFRTMQIPEDEADHKMDDAPLEMDDDPLAPTHRAGGSASDLRQPTLDAPLSTTGGLNQEDVDPPIDATEYLNYMAELDKLDTVGDYPEGSAPRQALLAFKTCLSVTLDDYNTRQTDLRIKLAAALTYVETPTDANRQALLNTTRTRSEAFYQEHRKLVVTLIAATSLFLMTLGIALMATGVGIPGGIASLLCGITLAVGGGTALRDKLTPHGEFAVEAAAITANIPAVSKRGCMPSFFNKTSAVRSAEGATVKPLNMDEPNGNASSSMTSR